MSQNYENHIRWNKAYHFITVPVILIACGIAIYNFSQLQTLTNALVVFAFVMIGITIGFARFFALKVQDRAARADERLRYYILAGKMLPSELKMSQILALRFASDEEFLALIDRTLKENLSSKEIKFSIKNWRGDYHRI